MNNKNEDKSEDSSNYEFNEDEDIQLSESS